MKKKLLALLTALMLLMGCCAALAQTGHAMEDYLGYWKLESLSANDQTVNADALGWNGFVIFREDGTVIFALDDDSFTGTTAFFEDGACVIESNRKDIPAAIGEDGKLYCSADIEGAAMDIVFVRVQQPAVPAQIAAWEGAWELAEVTMSGNTLPAEVLTQYSMVVYGDGFGTLHLGGMGAAFRLWEEDGVVKGIDAEDMTFTAWNDEQGRLCLEMPDADLTIVCRRTEAEQAPAAEAESPAVPAASEENPFIGQWQGVNVSLMGMEFDLEAAGLGDISLRIEQDMAYIVMGGEDGSCPTLYEGDTCVFTNGTESIVCTIEDGYMYMTLDVDGAAVRVKMERVGGEAAPAESAEAEETTETVQTAAASSFDGAWIVQGYELMGLELDAADVGMSITLVIQGDQAEMDVDGEVLHCLVSVNGSACTLYDDSDDTIECVLTEEGVLLMDMESDGVSLTVKMVRDGDAPAVLQTPAATESPAASTPVEGFDGLWNVAYVDKNGVLTPAAELGVTGSLKVSGDSARYTFGEKNLLGILTIGETELSLTTREGDMDFTLNAQGYLCHETQMDGAQVVVYFLREGAAAEAPVPAGGATQAPAATEAPAAPKGFDGHWRAMSVEVMGMTFTLEELGVESLDLVVSGDTAQTIYDGSSDPCTVTVDGDRLIIYDGSMYMPFYFDENGQAILELEMDGLTLKAFMTYIGE